MKVIQTQLSYTNSCISEQLAKYSSINWNQRVENRTWTFSLKANKVVVCALQIKKTGSKRLSDSFLPIKHTFDPEVVATVARNWRCDGHHWQAAGIVGRIAESIGISFIADKLPNFDRQYWKPDFYDDQQTHWTEIALFFDCKRLHFHRQMKTICG